MEETNRLLSDLWSFEYETCNRQTLQGTRRALILATILVWGGQRMLLESVTHLRLDGCVGFRENVEKWVQF